ncbi:GNAT family N-acetyltransferase [Paenibacillus apiarius]|uniref:GNAT family N-acetyltransferase n=1 Tax=Paenibacillus apiarius TaxID=46240 RepID=UPI003B3A629D
MIIKLDENDLDKIRPLLKNEQSYDLTLNAVINGNNRGTVYVDNPEHPGTAMIDVTGTITMFIGDPANEDFLRPLPDFIDNQLKIDTLESCGGTYFLAVVSDDAWGQAIEKAISHRNYETDFEWYHAFNAKRFHTFKSAFKPLPAGYAIRRIDKAMIENDPKDILSEVLNEFWYSTDDFLKIGLGYCVLKGNQIISSCLSCCVNGQNHEISVETYNDEDMNKGFATLACAAYLEHSLVTGITPHWSALETNKESLRLGAKLGFEFAYKRKTFEFEF